MKRISNQFTAGLYAVQHVNLARMFRGDGSIGSIEQYAGIRNRPALWNRARTLVGGPTTAVQVLIDCAMNRCRRLAALRAYRNERQQKKEAA